jgi:hypothetical protein
VSSFLEAPDSVVLAHESFLDNPAVARA